MTQRKWLLPVLLATSGLLCLVAQAEEETPLEAKALKTAGIELDVKKREVRVDGTVCLERGILEYLVCLPNTFEHEAVFSIKCKPSVLHLSLLAIGLEPYGFEAGGDWWADARDQPKSRVRIEVEYEKDDEKLRRPISEFFPAYDGKGYEIVGFGWHQGWNDGCEQRLVDEYEKNMAHFIRDVRKELDAPKLLFVIGGSGFGGWEQKNARRLGIMKAQEGAASQPEFKDAVRYIETRGFFRPPEESPSKQGYHWNGNAETYYLIGEGMGKAMVELLGGPKAPANPTGPSGK